MATTAIRRYKTPLPIVGPEQAIRFARRLFEDYDPSLVGSFSPALDVEESDDAFTLVVEIPGIAPDAVDVSIEDGVITISGNRDFYADKSVDDFPRVERRFGRFHRTLRLTDRVDPDGVTAAYTHGLLTVTVPKAEEAKPRKITVTTNES